MAGHCATLMPMPAFGPDGAILMQYDHMTTLCAKHVLRAIQRLLGVAPVIELLPTGFTLSELLVENVLGWLPCEAEG